MSRAPRHFKQPFVPPDHHGQPETDERTQRSRCVRSRLRLRLRAESIPVITVAGLTRTPARQERIKSRIVRFSLEERSRATNTASHFFSAVPRTCCWRIQAAVNNSWKWQQLLEDAVAGSALKNKATRRLNWRKTKHNRWLGFTWPY